MTTEPTSSLKQTNPRFVTQLPRNLAANIAYFVINIIIGILLIPYFISTLGVATYGLIPLISSITGYVGIVIQSLNTSVSRFLTIDLQRGDYEEANKTFNTALLGLSAIILLMIPFVLVIAFFVPSIFQVPTGQEASTAILILGVSGAFLIRSWSGNFTVQLFAYNRLDLQNLVNLTNLLIQTGLILLFFTIFGPNLALVGGAYLIGAVVASGISIIFARRVCPHLKVSIRNFDRKRVVDLCGMGWWVIINQMGSLLFYQVDLMVVNFFLGATSAGEYAIALQWVVLLRGVAGVLSGIVTPTILSYYARKQTETLIQASKSTVKLLGLAMALPVGLICGLAPQLLTAWVGEEFAFLAPLMVLLTVHLAFNVSVQPLFSINVAYNKVRLPGLVTFFAGFGNLVLEIALVLLTGWGYYGVAFAGTLALTLKNALFTPWNAARVLGIKSHTFTRSILPGIAATALIGITAATLGAILPLAPLVILIVVGVTITLAYILAVWMFGLSKFERGLFGFYLPPIIRRGLI